MLIQPLFSFIFFVESQVFAKKTNCAGSILNKKSVEIESKMIIKRTQNHIKKDVKKGCINGIIKYYTNTLIKN